MANETHLSLLARVQETTFGSSWNEFSAMYDGLIQGWLHRQGVQSERVARQALHREQLVQLAKQ